LQQNASGVRNVVAVHASAFPDLEWDKWLSTAGGKSCRSGEGTEAIAPPASKQPKPARVQRVASGP
jgi:hypothetical protein